MSQNPRFRDTAGRITSEIGTKRICRGRLAMSAPEVDRACRASPDTSVFDPGRVKTQSVLWFPLLNRGGMMKGFVQGADRQQTTLLPECLDDWVGESNPA